MASQDSGRNPRQVFGAMVRFYRERAGLSRSELARQICKSVSLVQAIELGQRAATGDVTADLETALSAGGALIRLRDEMGEGLGCQAHPSWFQEWTLKEAQATTLRSFEPLVVPGLLQTEGYARAIFRTRFKITSDEIDERVAARLKRQQVLTRDDPAAFWVILIEVIPASTGAHEGMAGAFLIADFDGAPSVGYQEGAVHGQPVDEPKDVALLDLTWDTLRSETLPRAASLAVLEEAAKSWTSAT